MRYTWVHNEAVVQTGKDMLGKTDAELFPAEEADRLTQIKAARFDDGRRAAPGSCPHGRTVKSTFMT